MKKAANRYIRSFSLEGMWGGKANVNWKHLNEDVNILVGINGAGKTTMGWEDKLVFTEDIITFTNGK